MKTTVVAMDDWEVDAAWRDPWVTPRGDDMCAGAPDAHGLCRRPVAVSGWWMVGPSSNRWARVTFCLAHYVVCGSYVDFVQDPPVLPAEPDVAGQGELWVDR